MCTLRGFALGLLLTVPVVAQPALVEPPDFPGTLPGPGTTHPGTGCFWLATGSIELGDTDWVQVTLPFESERTIVDVDFASPDASSELFVTILNVTSAYNNDDRNNATDGVCGLGADSDPVGSLQDSAVDLGPTPVGSVVDISASGSDGFGFTFIPTQEFTYDVWVYAIGTATGCTSDADCDDGIGCTTDTCVVATGTCTNTPDDNACNNGVFCDGAETCDPTTDCQPGSPPDCDDGVACTVDTCDPATDACANQPSDDLCSDGLFCNGAETCDPTAGCQPGTWPCAPGETCDEINGCQAVALPTLDIKPGTCPNRINTRGRGVIPIALAGTPDIAAVDVDLTTLAISRVDGVGGAVQPNLTPPGPHVVFDDLTTPFAVEECVCRVLSADGIVDVLMMFRLPDLVNQLELDQVDSGTLVELVVTGQTLDGAAFAATDCVQVMQRGRQAASKSGRGPGRP